MAARNPLVSLACATRTEERISDGITVAQVGVGTIVRAIVHVSREQWWE